MAESYPLPDYAVSMWIVGDDLLIAFPGTGPEGKGHTVKMPATEGGLKAALQIMRDRAASRYGHKLGQPGTPAQYDLDAISRFLKKNPPAKPKPKAAKPDPINWDDLLEDLGL